MTLGTPCSLQSAAVGEPLAGTAPEARGWVIVEQGGPWGRDVLVDSLLPDEVKVALRQLKSDGLGVLLVRRLERGERGGVEGPHRVFLAVDGPEGASLWEAELDDLLPLSALTVSDVLVGPPSLPFQRTDRPVLLVCTHSRRDQCCAVHGRALVAGLRERAPVDLADRIWECSHVGGHRFAPVTLSLPMGVVHGRCSIDEAITLAELLDQGRVLPDRMRGRTRLAPALQAAEVAVRRETADDDAHSLDVVGAETNGSDLVADVRHRDGRTWRCTLRRVVDDVMRAESCGKEALPLEYWQVTDLHPTS